MAHRSRRVSSVLAGTLFMLGVCATSAWADPGPIQCTGGIGDLVWFDENQNGLRDPEEAAKGINGVELQLTDSTGNVVASRITGAAVGSLAGSYGFGPICAGTYTVAIVAGVPAGYVPTSSPAGADPARDSNMSPVVVTLGLDAAGNAVKDRTIDFGFISGCKGSIGNRVWDDLNHNGTQDAGEPGTAGVSVSLSLNGSLEGTTSTDANGNYLFPGLCSGNYVVTVVTPPGLTPSPSNQGSDVTVDSDANPVVVALGPNENNLTIDFGFYTACTGIIGDRVWFDANRNGVQEPGELGIGGVTLQLVNSSGAIAGTTISNSDGLYQFTGICADTYTVIVDATTLPAGVAPSPASPPASGTVDTDSNISPASVVVASNSIDLSIDFGYYAPCAASIGDFVWSDINGDGIQNAGETGIPFVRVLLRDAVSNAVLAVDTTDAFGAYLFEGLCQGDYVVEVDPTTLAPSAVPSPANLGSNDSVDSDGVNHAAAVSVLAGNANLTVDFGYYKSTQIQVVKRTNGTNNNAPTGPQVLVGSTVTWTYSVTNTGSTEPLSNVQVVDNNGTTILTDDFSPTFTSGDTDGDGLLDVGETWIFTATGIAKAGQYSNVGVATGTGQLSKKVVQSQDLDHYFGFQDTTKPVCYVYGNASPPYMSYQDTGSGIVRLDVLVNLYNNFRVTITPSPTGFTPSLIQPYPMPAGTVATFSTPVTALIKVSAVRISTSKGAQLTVKATDKAGNTVTCDPVETTVTKLRHDRGIQTFTEIPFEEHIVTIENGVPGLRAMDVIVNNVEFRARQLDDHDVRVINIKSAMRRNGHNTITLVPRGRKGESADVSIGPE
jgi:SdrD B-like domain